MSKKIERMTFRGQPIETDLFWSKEDYYQFQIAFLNLCEEDVNVIKAPFDGPYTIDITPDENGFKVTFRNGENETQTKLPTRAWVERFRIRLENVDKSDRLYRHGSAHEIESHDMLRSNHHNESAGLLLDALAGNGITIDFRNARNLFDTIAQLLKPVVKDRGPGAQTFERE